MKIGVNFKVDVTKLDKSRFFQGKKGTYVDLTAFIDTENKSDYGDNGVISQSLTQDERRDGVKMPIVGNCKVFFTSESGPRERLDNKPMTPSDVPF